MGRRPPEQPEWALMLNPSGRVVRVRERDADEKRRQGWILVAAESEFLPWPTTPVNEQSNPRRRPDDPSPREGDEG